MMILQKMPVEQTPRTTEKKLMKKSEMSHIRRIALTSKTVLNCSRVQSKSHSLEKTMSNRVECSLLASPRCKSNG